MFREFSFATVLMICDEVPTSTNLSQGVCKETRTLLEKDFSIAYSGEWSILTSLRENKASAERTIEAIVNGNYGDDLEFSFTDFKLGEDATWTQDIENKIGSLIYLRLFEGRSKVGKAIRDGFLGAVASSKSKVKENVHKSMEDGLAELTSDNLRCLFSGKNSVTAKEFMTQCTFSTSLPSYLKDFFNECIFKMSSAERSRLSIFITSVEYFGSHIIIVTMDTGERVTDQSLPTSSTCFQTLYLPPYKDVDTMYRKLCYACLDRSFGIV